jgi:hypothetical protein
MLEFLVPFVSSAVHFEVTPVLANVLAARRVSTSRVRATLSCPEIDEDLSLRRRSALTHKHSTVSSCPIEQCRRCGKRGAEHNVESSTYLSFTEDKNVVTGIQGAIKTSLVVGSFVTHPVWPRRNSMRVIDDSLGKQSFSSLVCANWPTSDSFAV